MESQRLSPLREEKELEEFLDAGGIDDLASETEAEHKFGVSHVSRFATCSMRQRKVIGGDQDGSPRIPSRPAVPGTRHKIAGRSRHRAVASNMVNRRQLHLTGKEKAKQNYYMAKSALLNAVDKKLLHTYQKPGSTDGDRETVSAITSNGRTRGGMTLTSDEEAAAKARKAEQQQPPAMGHGSVEKVLRVPKHLKRSVAATKAEAKMDPSSKKAARAKRKPLKRGLASKIRSKIKAALYGSNARTFFERYDKNRSGTLDEREFKKMLRTALHIPPKDFADRDIANFIASLDGDGDGLEIDELAAFVELGIDGLTDDNRKEEEKDTKEEESLAMSEGTFALQPDYYVDIDDLLSLDDTIVSKLDDVKDGEQNIRIRNELRKEMGEDMNMYFNDAQAVMLRRAATKSAREYHEEHGSHFDPAEEDKNNSVLPIDTRGAGSPVRLSVPREKVEAIRRAVESEAKPAGCTDVTLFGRSLTSPPPEPTAVGGAVRIVDARTGQPSKSFQWSDEDGLESVHSATAPEDTDGAAGKPGRRTKKQDLVRGDGSNVHSDVLYGTLRSFQSTRVVVAAPHVRACSAYLNACFELQILPLPILDHIRIYGVDSNGEDLVSLDIHHFCIGNNAGIALAKFLTALDILKVAAIMSLLNTSKA